MNSVLVEQANLELGLVNTDSLLTLLECPVCLDHITPPIKQCVKGHLVCTDCYPRYTNIIMIQYWRQELSCHRYWLHLDTIFFKMITLENQQDYTIISAILICPLLITMTMSNNSLFTGYHIVPHVGVVCQKRGTLAWSRWPGYSSSPAGITPWAVPSPTASP